MKNNRQTMGWFKGTLVAIALIGSLAICSYVETHYTRENCTVVQKCGVGVTVEDELGHLWSYEIKESEPLKIGDVVDLSMDTCCTDSIYDDVVLSYKKVR